VIFVTVESARDQHVEAVPKCS